MNEPDIWRIYMNVVTNTISSFAVGLLSGVIGTGLGGAFSFLVKNPSNRFLSFAYGLSAGMMISIVCFDMLPEAFEFSTFINVCIYVLIGALLVIILDDVLEQIESKNANSARRTDHHGLGKAFLLTIAVAAHNFPEGLAIGSTMSVNTTFGIGMAIIITLHDIPEGVAIAASLIGRGIKQYKIALYAAISGIPTGIGALVGIIAGNISDEVIGACLALAGGAMMVICVSELIPTSNDLYHKNFSGFSVTIGFIFGIILTSLI